MITFADSQVLWLLLPLAAGMWALGRIQYRALAWLERHVGARFRHRFSIYDRRSLGRHLFALAATGALLVVAAAAPGKPGEAEATSIEGRVLFLVDASASMFADDAEPVVASEEETARRIEVARQLALELLDLLPGYRFALASYSGSGVVHLPMTTNLGLLADALGSLENHNYYKNTGSSLSAALDVVSHFTDPERGRLQVVMLGDGELAREDDYDRALHALAAQQVVVHALSIGSLEGQSRVIYDFRDVLAEKENPKVLSEYRTRRVDRHLKKIASRADGFFAVAEPGVTARLAEAVRATAAAGHSVVHEAGRRDLTPWVLALVLAAFLFDALLYGHGTRATSGFELDRLGSRPNPRPNTGGHVARALPLLLAATLLASCGDSPRERAHYENESGIGHDAFRRHAKARPHYDRSRGYGIEPEIPTHNLARSVALAGDVSEAHDLFQEALTIDPALAEAMFNDGVTLYLWGAAERDPKNCDLERTRDLWNQAAARFATTATMETANEELLRQTRANREFLREALAEIQELIVNPPEECLSDAPQPSGGEGGGEGEDEDQQEEDQEEEEGKEEGGGNGEQEESQGGSEGEPDEDQKAGAAGGESPPEEGEGGESGGGGGAAGQQPQGGGSAGGLSEQQLAEIRDLIGQIAARGKEGNRFHRRTGPEQFSKEDWENPDPSLWW